MYVMMGAIGLLEDVCDDGGYLLCSFFWKFVWTTVVPATAGPLGERPPALAGHFCNVPTTLPC